jgi:hypothetical protein
MHNSIIGLINNPLKTFINPSLEDIEFVNNLRINKLFKKSIDRLIKSEGAKNFILIDAKETGIKFN